MREGDNPYEIEFDYSDSDSIFLTVFLNDLKHDFRQEFLRHLTVFAEKNPDQKAKIKQALIDYQTIIQEDLHLLHEPVIDPLMAFKNDL